MIILDNSVLSSFVKLNLLDQLKDLFNPVYIMKEIFNEYSVLFSNKLPEFIIVEALIVNFSLPDHPSALSTVDLSIIQLSINKKISIATDDLTLRKYAKTLNIKVTGIISILRGMWEKNLINDRKEYLNIITDLQEDLYLTPELIEWLIRDKF